MRYHCACLFSISLRGARIVQHSGDQGLGVASPVSHSLPQGGIKSVSSRQQRYDDLSLIRPQDPFWPLDRYRRKFGSPSRPEAKKLKHVKMVVDGVAGVVVPGDDGEGPWLLERRSGTRMENDREDDVGSSGGEEAAASDLPEPGVLCG